MATLTDGLKLSIPDLTETADGPDAFSRAVNGVEDYVYDRILPSGVTRYPIHHWGSGTTLPTLTNGAKAGDLYLHTGLGCTMRCITPGNTTGTNIWRQAEVSIVVNVAARDAIATNYSALLYEGFEVRVNQVTGPPVVLPQHYYWTAGATWFEAPVLGSPTLRLRDTSQTIAANTWVALIFNVEEIDTSDMWVSGTPTQIFCRKSGYYSINAGWSPNGFVTARRLCSIWKNGTPANIGRTVAFAGGDGGDLGVQAAGSILLNVGDYIQVMAYQDSTASQTLSAVDYSPAAVDMAFIRPS